jgi:hypothetical protein
MKSEAGSSVVESGRTQSQHPTTKCCKKINKLRRQWSGWSGWSLRIDSKFLFSPRRCTKQYVTRTQPSSGKTCPTRPALRYPVYRLAVDLQWSKRPRGASQ